MYFPLQAEAAVTPLSIGGPFGVTRDKPIVTPAKKTKRGWIYPALWTATSIIVLVLFFVSIYSNPRPSGLTADITRETLYQDFYDIDPLDSTKISPKREFTKYTVLLPILFGVILSTVFSFCRLSKVYIKAVTKNGDFDWRWLDEALAGAAFVWSLCALVKISNLFLLLGTTFCWVIVIVCLKIQDDVLIKAYKTETMKAIFANTDGTPNIPRLDFSDGLPFLAANLVHAWIWVLVFIYLGTSAAQLTVTNFAWYRIAVPIATAIFSISSLVVLGLKYFSNSGAYHLGRDFKKRTQRGENPKSWNYETLFWIHEERMIFISFLSRMLFVFLTIIGLYTTTELTN